jgi:hypothetical protein
MEPPEPERLSARCGRRRYWLIGLPRIAAPTTRIAEIHIRSFETCFLDRPLLPFIHVCGVAYPAKKSQAR